MSRSLRLAVLISGNGSNLQAIIDAIECGELDASIVLVLSNEPDAFGLQRARRHGLATRVLDHRDFPDRESFDRALAAALTELEPDVIVLAGFMRILGAEFIDAFADRILNIHPSLLPRYKGLDTHRRALDNHEKEHGVSIHLVTARLDDGPVILQARYPIGPGDSVADLQARGHRLEHRMYPLVLHWLAEERLVIERGRIRYDGKPLDDPLQMPAA